MRWLAEWAQCCADNGGIYTNSTSNSMLSCRITPCGTEKYLFAWKRKTDMQLGRYSDCLSNVVDVWKIECANTFTPITPAMANHAQQFPEGTHPAKRSLPQTAVLSTFCPPPWIALCLKAVPESSLKAVAGVVSMLLYIISEAVIATWCMEQWRPALHNLYMSLYPLCVLFYTHALHKTSSKWQNTHINNPEW